MEEKVNAEFNVVAEEEEEYTHDISLEAWMELIRNDEILWNLTDFI